MLPDACGILGRYKPDVIRRLLSALAMLCLHGAASAAPCAEPPADPLNTYDAPHTYAKLVRDYPAIRIASAALPVDVNRIADLTYA